SPDVGSAAASLLAAEEALASAQHAAAQAAASATQGDQRVNEAQDRLARAEEADPSEPCPTCGRPLGEDFAGYLKHCRSDLAAATRALVFATKEAREGQRQLAKADVALRAARESESASRVTGRARADLER